MKGRINKIISFDVDMTLYDSRKREIPKSAMKALEMLRDDTFIVIATGRDMYSEVSRHILEAVRPDAIIHMNGARVTVGDDTIYDHPMDKALLARIIRFAREHPSLCIGATLNGIHYYSDMSKMGSLEAFDRRWGVGKMQFYPIESLMEQKVYTLLMHGGASEASYIESNFPELRVPVVIEGSFADIVPAGESKAAGMDMLLDYIGESMEHVTAFGDSLNDIELISRAKVGVAMGNAQAAVRDAADMVADTIDNDGVYKALVTLAFLPDP